MAEGEDLPESLQALWTNLGHTLRAEFHEAEQYRQEVEQRWLADLRQYKGEYGPEVTKGLDPNKSRVFVKLTRKKCRTIEARLRDMLFPATGERNWSIGPTPQPELAPQDEQRLADKIRQKKEQAFQQQAQQAGAPPQISPDALEPSDQEMEDARQEMAKRKAEAMAEQMDDQLTESKYQEECSDVIHGGVVYGTGILKGPLVDEQPKQRWRYQGGETAAGWTITQETEYQPYYEHVPVWDCYPDMAARRPESMRYVWQRHIMPRHEVLALADREDFDSETILEYLRHYQQGDVSNRDWEHSLQSLGERETVHPSRSYRFEVLERWGVLSADDLREAGVEVEEGEVGEWWANVWLLGEYVIKVAIQPIDGMEHPYHFFYFDKDETSVLGEGVPALMRDDQEIANAGTRAMLDNAATAAGGVYEVLADLLDADEDPRQIHAGRVFVRSDNADSQTASLNALRQLNIQPFTADYQQIIAMGERWAHEHTVPSYMEGQAAPGGGAADTASGMSMLMGAANIEIKDLVRNFDEGITKPSITDLYHWNMTFARDESVKGDFQIQPKGSASLVAKEVRGQNLMQFGQMLQDPEMRAHVDIGQYTRETAESLDLRDVLLSEEEARRRQEQQGPSPDMIEAKASAAEDKADAAEAKAEAERERTQAMKARVDAVEGMLQAMEEYGGPQVAAMIQQMRGGNDGTGSQAGNPGGGQQPAQPGMAGPAGGQGGAGQERGGGGGAGPGATNPGAAQSGP